MVVIKWHVKWKQIAKKFWQLIIWKMSQIVLTANSFTYNAHLDRSYVIDILLEPIFWFVGNFARYLGRVFVLLVVILTAAVVIVAYWIGLPYWWEKSPVISVCLVIFGNWILLNIVFHYYMGIFTPPGSPPHGSLLLEAASICKKCICPRPPRTHHCSVCDRCILGMDHHCPWLDNCVGYFNARYFYLYMVYMAAGVSFLIIFGIDIGFQVLWANNLGLSSAIYWVISTLGMMYFILPFILSYIESKTEQASDTVTDADLIGHPVRMNKTGALVPLKVFQEYDDLVNFPREHYLPIPEMTEIQRICANTWKTKAVLIMAGTCLSTLVALGVLLTMHGRHINQGETSVEAYINVKLKKKGNYRNPYDFGIKNNWRLFLGLVKGRTFIRHVLWPSAHKPVGDGLTWHALHRALDDWP